jgi:hypothetical protein
MYTQTDTTALSSPSATRPRPTRAALRTRPRLQRTLIRSWEYTRPVRIGILIVRLLVVLWLVVCAALLTSAGYTWGWTMLLAAAATFAISAWVFATATKGWPVVEG